MLLERKEFKDVHEKQMQEIKTYLEKSHHGDAYSIFEVITVLYELYNNSKKHAQATVDIIIKFYQNSLVIRMNDDGQGFDAKEGLKITKEDIRKNIDKPHGRGLFIVKNFTSDIYYNRKGNNVLLRFKKE